MSRRLGGQIFVTFLILCHTTLHSFVIPNNDAPWSGTYRCVDYGETFAASWLASVSALDGIKKYRSVLKSHRAAHASHYITWERAAHKTVDALDFFVEHLSAYERRLNIGKFRAGKFQESLRRSVTDVLGHLLRRYTLSHFHSSALQMKLSGDENRILGIILYYGEGLGKCQAQSSLETRKVYLEATYCIRVICTHFRSRHLSVQTLTSPRKYTQSADYLQASVLWRQAEIQNGVPSKNFRDEVL